MFTVETLGHLSRPGHVAIAPGNQKVVKASLQFLCHMDAIATTCREFDEDLICVTGRDHRKVVPQVCHVGLIVVEEAVLHIPLSSSPTIAPNGSISSPDCFRSFFPPCLSACLTHLYFPHLASSFVFLPPIFPSPSLLFQLVASACTANATVRFQPF